MSALIFGVGVGLFIIIALWAVALVLCLVSLRAQKNVALIGILAATLITSFLLFLPHDLPSEPTDSARVSKVHDHFFIWRILLIIFLALSVITGTVIYVYTHLMEPKFARPIVKQQVKVE